MSINHPKPGGPGTCHLPSLLSSLRLEECNATRFRALVRDAWSTSVGGVMATKGITKHLLGCAYGTMEKKHTIPQKGMIEALGKEQIILRLFRWCRQSFTAGCSTSAKRWVHLMGV